MNVPKTGLKSSNILWWVASSFIIIIILHLYPYFQMCIVLVQRLYKRRDAAWLLGEEEDCDKVNRLLPWKR